MLNKEHSNLFIFGATFILGTLFLLCVFLYSTDKLILDISTITKSGYTSQQKIYTLRDATQRITEQKKDRFVYPKDHPKIVNRNTTVKHPIEKSLTLSADVVKKSNPFFSNAGKVVTFIPKIIAVNPLLTAGKYGSTGLLKLAFHSVKIISGKHI